MLWQRFWQRLPIRGRERIYILPTRAGTAFLFFTISLLLMGAIYNSQLVNLMAFLLLTLYGLAMILTHQNLRGLHGLDVQRAEAFAKEPGILELSFQNESGHPKEGLKLDLLSGPTLWPRGATLFSFPVEDAATERKWVPLMLQLKSESRGRFRIQRIRLSTQAPLGLFRAWRSEKADFDLWVYPERMRLAEVQTSDASAGQMDEASSRVDRAEAWTDSQPADFGGSVRRMDWARFAKTDQAWVRPWNAEEGQQRDLDWDQYKETPIEKRLSHFTFEVEQAVAKNEDLKVIGPWGQREIDASSARDLYRLWAEWKS